MKQRFAQVVLASFAVLSTAVTIQPRILATAKTVSIGQKLDPVCQARKDAFKEAFDKTALSESEDPCRNGKEKCVIALSLYCVNNKCNPFYSDGVQRNIKFAKMHYPGWKIRLYTDGSVTPDVKKKINASNVEEVVLKEMAGQGPISGMFWRFFATNDETVDRIMVRDIDSVVNLRERATVNEWIKSGKKWHIIYDHPMHRGWPIVGGEWGVMKLKGEKSAIPAEKIEIPCKKGQLSRYMGAKGGDQDFLRDAVWPLVGSNYLEHSSYNCHPGPNWKPVPVPRRGPRDTICYPNGYWNEDDLYDCDLNPAQLDAKYHKFLLQHSPPQCRASNKFGNW
eukprot:TRINITY_DN1948_c0_g1_i1.p1 TRINITY_DN1948_c0_g1~~TRINITY_DN1948_c0_g1_i1.p1  ORF type:complete len:337 (+),score=61.36 TRINITY_DN1948_c0_g1_i1:60-1070(+)